MFKSKGKLRYSPELNGNQERFWLIADCDKEVGNYYRRLYQNSFWKCRKLQRPSWEEHITIIRNEEPPLLELWDKYDGNEVEFFYDPILKSNDLYFWFDVECPEMLDIREELGLSRNPEYQLHLTIGNAIGSQT